MKTPICIALAVLLLVVQMMNGYALNTTKLYTPGFTYWLIAGIVVVGWLIIAVCWKLSKSA